jgi:hypothetical protein
MDRGELPSDRSEARRIARMAKSFTLVDGELYKRAASGVLQRCVPIPQGRELLCDIHAGVCGHHAAPRTLVGNAFRQGFYWPTAVADASEIVRTCEGCQFYARKSNLPAHVVQTIPVTWLLTDKRRIPLRSASVRTSHLFHHGIPKVLVNPRSKGITSV